MDFPVSDKVAPMASPMRISDVSNAIETVVPYEMTHAVAAALRVPIFAYITRENPVYMTVEQFFMAIADVTRNSPDHDRILDRLPGYLCSHGGGRYEDLVALRAEISKNEKTIITAGR